MTEPKPEQFDVTRPDVPQVQLKRPLWHEAAQIGLAALGLGVGGFLLWHDRISSDEFMTIANWAQGGGVVGAAVVPGVLKALKTLKGR